MDFFLHFLNANFISWATKRRSIHRYGPCKPIPIIYKTPVRYAADCYTAGGCSAKAGRSRVDKVGIAALERIVSNPFPAVRDAASASLRQIQAARKGLLLSCLGTLGAVLGAGLHSLGDALRVEGTADDVVTHTGEVTHTAAADKHYGVLLQVVADTGDIRGDFDTVGKTYSGDLTERGVRLLRGSGTDRSADASLLRRVLVGHLSLHGVHVVQKSRCLGLFLDALTSFSDQLVKSRQLIHLR